MIAILDYKMGNVQSIANMYKKIGFQSIVTNDIKTIEKAEKLILPGVGYYDYAMNQLRSSPYYHLLNHLVLEERKPILGICLGAQLMLESSEEGIPTDGLGWIGGSVKKFMVHDQNLRVPHMGWNDVTIAKQNSIVMDLPDDSRFYFVHSYYFSLRHPEDVLLTTDYGGVFTSAFSRENIYGVQFHPEKSHKYGMQLLKSFAEI